MSRRTGKERSKEQVVEDRAEISKRNRRGETQWQIGQALGYTRQQISVDLKAIRKEWQQSALVDCDKKQAEQLAKLDLLEVTYWEAWEDSRKDKETSVTERLIDNKDKEESKGRGRVKAQFKKEGQSGHPAFLDGVMRCISKRCDILGLDAPKQIIPTGKDGKELTFTLNIGKGEDKEKPSQDMKE